jgi:hypothetical protein
VRGSLEHELALAPDSRGLAVERQAIHDLFDGLARRGRYSLADDGLRGRNVFLHEHGRSG